MPEIARLGEDFEGQIGLAISLHAADDETRTRLMPINKKYPLAELMAGAAGVSAPQAAPHLHRVHAGRRERTTTSTRRVSSRRSCAVCR